MRTRATNAAAFVATAMNAVTGVGAPWYTSGVHWWKGAIEILNASPVRDQRHPHQDEGVARVAVGEHLVDLVEVGRSRRAVDERQPVEQRRRPERADDQVLEARLERSCAADRRPAQHVERHRQQLERDEERDQVLRLCEQRHAEHRRQQQRLEVAVPGSTSGGGGRVAPRHRDADRGREHRDQRRGEAQLVEAQRTRDQVLAGPPLPDAEAGGSGERGQGQRR